MKIIIGSEAAHIQGLLDRTPKDRDIWTDDPNYKKGKGEDVSIIPSDILTLIDVNPNGHARWDDLYTIKSSHLGWDNPMWPKHLQDLLVMKHKGCNIKEALYEMLLKHWSKVLSDKSFLSLKQDKEGFFNDYVDYKVDHDLLHDIAAGESTPIYKKCLKTNEDVLIDKNKFDILSREEQIKMFREEISVICFERWVIPSLYSNNINGNMTSWRKSYPWAVRKTITSLTKGWATDFLVRNLEVFVRPDLKIMNNLEDFINKQFY